MLARFVKQFLDRGQRSLLRAGYSRLLADDAAGARQIACDLLDRNAGFVDAYLLLAQAAAELGDWPRALASVDTYIAIAGERADAYYIRGLIQERRNNLEEAIADFASALRIDSSHAPALDRKGALHDARGEFDAALACAQCLVQVSPGNAEAYRKLGMTLRELGRFAPAVDALEAAAALDPRAYDARATLALCLIDLGRFEDADPVLARLLSEAGNHAQAHWARAVSNLLRGHFEVGWDDYEWRESRLDVQPRLPDVPLWDGNKIDRGYLLLTAEQGLGDQIMFASCIPDAIRLASGCIVECDTKLEALFRRSFPQAEVMAGSPSQTPERLQRFMPDVVAQLPLGSLPRLFRRSSTCFPVRPSYLVPDPSAVQRQRQSLRDLGAGPKVGLSWTGGAAKTRRRLRSATLAELLPVLRTPNCNFVSLQYVDSHGEIDGLRAQHHVTVHDVGAMRMDYDETAALVAALDIVISVCTSVIHLAGAVGTPVWILVPAAPEWRYMAAGTELPWYPRARIWRQKELGDWGEVVAQIATELARVGSTWNGACAAR